MADGFINSENVKVFPCGSRNKKFDPFARLTTEYNLVSIINKLVDKNSFIVTTHLKDTDLSNDNEPYIINIEGYLFTISTGAYGIIDYLSKDDGNYIIAKIITSPYIGKDGSIFQMLSPLKSGDTGLNYNYIKVNNNNNEYSQIGDSDIFYNEVNREYIRLVDLYNNGSYSFYKCLQNGDLIISTSSYDNEMLDSDNGKFLGIIFYKSNNNVVEENSLILFEKKSAYSQDDNGKYVLENGVFKYCEEVPEGTDIKNRYSIENESWVEYEDSKIKFKTDTEGNRSITIDDGEID